MNISIFIVMPPITPMDIFKLLDRSNCGRSGLRTCMGFSISVVGGDTPPKACHLIDPDTADGLAALVAKRSGEEGFQASIKELSRCP
jgi:ArsR family metal-binding transcriptional regulator